MWILVSACGSVAVGLRICPCLFVLMPITLGIAIVLLSASSLKGLINNSVNNVCTDMEGDFREFFTRVVNMPMCSDMCPCETEVYNEAEFDYLTTSLALQYDRAPFAVEGSLE